MKALSMVGVWIAGLVIIGAQTGSDRERDELVGPVHTVRAESVPAMRGASGLKEQGRRQPMDTVTYDERGNYSRRRIISDYGFPVGKQTFRYLNGRLAESRLVDPKGVMLERRQYSYRLAGGPANIVITGSDGHGYTEHYQRGAGGRIEEIGYVADGKTAGKTVFKYQGELQPSEVAFFDPAGRPTTAPIGPCLGVHRLVYRYLNSRVKEAQLYEEDGTLKRRSVFEHDLQGNVIEERRTDGLAPSLFKYEYEYDSRGNWTTRISTIDYDTRDENDGEALPVRVTFRVITYY